MRIPVFRSRAQRPNEAPGRPITARMRAEPFVQAELRRGEVAAEAFGQVQQYALMRHKAAVEVQIQGGGSGGAAREGEQGEEGGEHGGGLHVGILGPTPPGAVWRPPPSVSSSLSGFPRGCPRPARFPTVPSKAICSFPRAAAANSGQRKFSAG